MHKESYKNDTPPPATNDPIPIMMASLRMRLSEPSSCVSSKRRIASACVLFISARAWAAAASSCSLLGIADLPEVRVSLESCRQLDPQTRFVTICRLDVSPAETLANERVSFNAPPLVGHLGEPSVAEWRHSSIKTAALRAVAAGRARARERPWRSTCRSAPGTCQHSTHRAISRVTRGCSPVRAEGLHCALHAPRMIAASSRAACACVRAL
jgi:hypothetical protein